MSLKTILILIGIAVIGLALIYGPKAIRVNKMIHLYDKDNEWNNGYIENAKHIPVSELNQRLNEIQAFKDQPVFTYCAAGKRAERAKNLLIENGFTNVTNLGGIKDASKKLEKDIIE